MDQVRRDNRERGEEAGDGTDGEGSNESESDDCSDRESAGENVSVVRRFRGSKSSVYNHLLASPDCCNSYSDSSFTVLCRGPWSSWLWTTVKSFGSHLSVCISLICVYRRIV